MSDRKKNKIFGRLQEIAQGGRLTAKAVVEDARNEDSPLHAEFEWNDAKAAEKFRLEQARTLIQSFKVYIELRDVVIAAPAWVRDPDAESDEQGYRETATLKTDRERAMGALQGEASRAGAYLQRVRSLAAALDLQADVDEVLEKYGMFRQKIETPAT